MKVMMTSKNKKAYWEEKELPLVEITYDKCDLTIYPDNKKQSIEGFGGTFSIGSTSAYTYLTEDGKQKFMDLYFSEEGLTYNMVRIHMDLFDNNMIIPMIKSAQKETWNDVRFMLSTRGLTTLMKVINPENKELEIENLCTEKWTGYFKKLIREYEGIGLPIISVLIEKELEKQGIKQLLESKLKEEGLDYVEVFTTDSIEELAVNDEVLEEVALAEKCVSAIMLGIEEGVRVISDGNFSLDDKNLLYYYIGHFSKYIHRGAHVIEVVQENKKIKAIGFLNPTGERVIVVMNQVEEEVEFSMGEGLHAIKYCLEPRSIYTFIYRH